MLLNADYTFKGVRPTHIDCEILERLGKRAEQSTDDHSEEDYVLNVTGREFDDVMREAVSKTMDLVRSSGQDRMLEQLSLVMGVGEPIQYIAYYMVAWVAGLGAGLEQVRGMEMPEGGVDTPDYFWDLDGMSVAYTAHARCSVAALDHENLEDITQSKPLILMSACYIDGYVIGCGFDAEKNPHIEGRSVLL